MVGIHLYLFSRQLEILGQVLIERLDSDRLSGNQKRGKSQSQKSSNRAKGKENCSGVLGHSPRERREEQRLIIRKLIGNATGNSGSISFRAKVLEKLPILTASDFSPSPFSSPLPNQYFIPITLLKLLLSRFLVTFVC